MCVCVCPCVCELGKDQKPLCCSESVLFLTVPFVFVIKKKKRFLLSNMNCLSIFSVLLCDFESVTVTR